MAAQKKQQSSTKKKSSTQIKTVKEFKVWISALEEFQGDDWCPTPEQWSVIRDKIDGLNETERESSQASSYSKPPATYSPSPSYFPNGSSSAGPSYAPPSTLSAVANYQQHAPVGRLAPDEVPYDPGLSSFT